MCGTQDLPVARLYATIRASYIAPAAGTTIHWIIECSLLPVVGSNIVWIYLHPQCLIISTKHSRHIKYVEETPTFVDFIFISLRWRSSYSSLLLLLLLGHTIVFFNCITLFSIFLHLTIICWFVYMKVNKNRAFGAKIFY